jgi:hypothetical protein
MAKDESAARVVTERIRALNDQLRTTLRGGRILITSGVIARGTEFQQRALGLLQTYAAFDADNDPYGEHDFGALVCEGEKLFFKIDYYDRGLKEHSPDASDPDLTTRVLTLMLADEY